MCTTHPGPRYHPMGGTYPKTSQKGHGSERELNYNQDAQAVRHRGGMRGGLRGGSGGKDRGLRSPGSEGRQMGGSYVSEDSSNHTTPPERGGRGVGRGNRLTNCGKAGPIPLSTTTHNTNPEQNLPTRSIKRFCDGDTCLTNDPTNFRSNRHHTRARTFLDKAGIFDFRTKPLGRQSVNQSPLSENSHNL